MVNLLYGCEIAIAGLACGYFVPCHVFFRLLVALRLAHAGAIICISSRRRQQLSISGHISKSARAGPRRHALTPDQTANTKDPMQWHDCQCHTAMSATHVW